MGVVHSYLHTCTVVLVRYSIYRSISRYFDISSGELGIRYLTMYRSGVGIVRFCLDYTNCRYRSIAQNLDIAVATTDRCPISD